MISDLRLQMYESPAQRGVGIKPGASALGSQSKGFAARGNGRQRFFGEICRPLRGLTISFAIDPGVTLAKPRFTPGFILTPAPQAKIVKS